MQEHGGSAQGRVLAQALARVYSVLALPPSPPWEGVYPVDTRWGGYVPAEVVERASESGRAIEIEIVVVIETGSGPRKPWNVAVLDFGPGSGCDDGLGSGHGGMADSLDPPKDQDHGTDQDK